MFYFSITYPGFILVLNGIPGIDPLLFEVLVNAVIIELDPK
jgi:hypothetical protein